MINVFTRRLATRIIMKQKHVAIQVLQQGRRCSEN